MQGPVKHNVVLQKVKFASEVTEGDLKGTVLNKNVTIKGRTLSLET